MALPGFLVTQHLWNTRLKWFLLISGTPLAHGYTKIMEHSRTMVTQRLWNTLVHRLLGCFGTLPWFGLPAEVGMETTTPTLWYTQPEWLLRGYGTLLYAGYSS